MGYVNESCKNSRIRRGTYHGHPQTPHTVFSVAGILGLQLSSLGAALGAAPKSVGADQSVYIQARQQDDATVPNGSDNSKAQEQDRNSKVGASGHKATGDDGRKKFN